MVLKDLTPPTDAPPPPADVAALLAEADRRIDALMESHRNEPICGFVPSEFEIVHAGLRHIVDAHLAPGRAFLEWGSGFGVVTCMAAMLELDAYGIEINGELTQAAEQLANNMEIPAHFVHGTFIPAGAETCTDTVTETTWLLTGGADAYDEMGLDVDDFDIVFAYPWPGEHYVIEELFDQYAAVGALLLTNHGMEGLRLRRKIAPATEPQRSRR